jgi:cytochrome c oxidase cbb3-type subunit 3
MPSSLPISVVKYETGMNPANISRLLLCLLFFFASGTLAEDGEALYEAHCAICHGSDGTGGVGVPLAMPDFLRQSSDRYLRHTIREGRPGRIMPAFNHLSDAQIDSIVHYIRHWAPDIEAPRWSQAPVTGDSLKGQQLYTQHCQVCHGKQGRGGKGTGVMFSRKKDLPIMAPAIGNPGFLHAASDQMIRNIIVNGRPGTPMQAAANLGLDDSDVNHLVSYIRSLQDRPEDHSMDVSKEPAALIYESDYSFEETIANVKRAAKGMNFRLIRDQPLDQGLVKHGQESRHHMMVYFCNFEFLYQALAIDPRAGLFLPCRVTVVEQDGKVKVMSINPKRLSRLFNNNQLDHACDEMYRLYSSILEEATL